MTYRNISSKYKWNHYSFWIGNKPRTNLLGLTEKSKAALINKLSEVKLILTDELYIAPSDLWTYIDSRLGEIFMMIPEKAFTGLSVMTVADLLQLLPIIG